MTYLTKVGAPTLVLDKIVDSIQGGGSVERDGGEVKKGWVSYPMSGKHIAFDGRLMHAVVADLKSTTLEEEVEKYKGDNGDRRGRRITFLVNCWYDYKPLQIARWDNDGPFVLSKEGEYDDVFAGAEATDAKKVECGGDEMSSFEWQIGSDELLTMKLPNKELQRNEEMGETCEIVFNDGDARLTEVVDERESKRRKV